VVADADQTQVREMTMWRAIIILGLGIVFGVVAYFVFRPTPDSVCLSLLPQKASAGFTVDGKTINVNIGALQESSGANPEQALSFIECLKRSNPEATVQSSNGVIIPREPIGQLSDAWNKEQGLRIALEPNPASPEDNRVLQNLAIGPAAGTKSAVVKNWCTAIAQACVTCDPPDVSQNEVVVRLKDKAPVERRQMSGRYPPSPSNPHQPWEDVNEKGERYYYECQR
jgi:hypothetical protein